MNNTTTERPKMGCGTILIGILVLAAFAFFAPRLFGGNDGGDVVNDTDDVSSQSVDDGIDLGELVVAESVDRDGCPVNATSNLGSVDTFYVVAPNSEIPEGTDIFVRLYQDDVAVEDLPLITANQDYQNTCINFVFESTDGFAFESGEYEAEFWVNGNSYDSVRFLVQ